MNLIHLVALFLGIAHSLSLKKSTCDGLLDPGECISKTVLGAHACVYCAQDKMCHDVGSLYDPCTDDCCASQSSLSTCKWGDYDSIPQTCYPTKPEQIHIAFSGQKESGYPDGMTVSWFTPVQTDTSVVRYGMEANSLVNAIKGPPCVSYLSGHGYHHHVVLSGLLPSTAYFYQVGDSVGGFSEVFSFTMPADSPDRPVSLALFGDMGYLGSEERGPMIIPAAGGLVKKWSAVPTRNLLERLKDEGSIDLMMLVGDIGYADDAFAYSLSFSYEEVLNGYMNWMQNISSVMPWMVNPGNHEVECHSPTCLLQGKYHNYLSNFTAYNKRFRMPSASSGGRMSMWYSFNIGPIHWISVNTETDWPDAPSKKVIYKAGGFGEDGEYLKWLEADLAAAHANRAQRPWIVASGHRPISELPSHGPLFDKYGLDAYFSGHVHAYARSGPTTSAGVVDKAAMKSERLYVNASGCLYVVTGSAGCDEMDYVVDAQGRVHAEQRPHDASAAVPPGSLVKTIGVKTIGASEDPPDPDVESDKISAGVIKADRRQLSWQLLNAYSGEVIDEVVLTKTL